MTMWFGGRTILTQACDSKPLADERERSPFAYEVKDLQAWSIGNWNQLPEPERKRCLNKLRSFFITPDGVEAVGHWRDQVARGVDIGDGDDWFHFGAGMAIRNALRTALPDDKLPPIRQPNGEMGQNWDDFYIGAIHALVTDQSVEVNEKVAP